MSLAKKLVIAKIGAPASAVHGEVSAEIVEEDV